MTAGRDSPAEAAVAVSVIIPVRNGARYLDRALESLTAQTFTAFEIVVVDNGSTDQTPAILARWSAREPRLRTIRLDHAQLSESLNRAAGAARAPLLARLDADDIARPDRLEVQVAAMAARPEVGLLGSAATLIDGQGRRLGAISPPLGDQGIRSRQRSSTSLIPSSTIMRANVLRRVGGYRKGLNIAEDFDLWTRMIEHCRAENLAQRLISYRIHAASVTARQPVRMALAALCVAAAVEARRHGIAEPFVEGTPSLRRALPLLGLSRPAARRMIRVRSAINLLHRRLYGAPLPPFIKMLSPRLARWLGLVGLYRRWLAARPDRSWALSEPASAIVRRPAATRAK
jgi:hypothetical protein